MAIEVGELLARMKLDTSGRAAHPREYPEVLFLECTLDDRLDHAYLVSVDQELLSSRDAKLLKNTGEVMAHGDDRYACLVGNFLISQSLTDEPHNVPLALGQ